MAARFSGRAKADQRNPRKPRSPRAKRSWRKPVPCSFPPNVEAAARFVEATGRRAAIGSLDDVLALVAGTAGTIVARAD